MNNASNRLFTYSEVLDLCIFVTYSHFFLKKKIIRILVKICYILYLESSIMFDIFVNKFEIIARNLYFELFI